MNIGFSTIFSYRPHVEHMFYLAQQFRKNGHEDFYLNCSGALPNCYNLEFKDKRDNRLTECMKCKLGSLYSYTKKNTTFISPKSSEKLSAKKLKSITESSSYTLTRIENPKDMGNNDVLEIQKRAHSSVQITYANAKNWIQNNELDFVFFFNGRMDITKAIMQACIDTETKFCAVERTLFAHGLQLNFGANALSLRSIHMLSKEYIDKPLKQEQALVAADLLTSRFKRAEHLEWRSYNKESKKVDWPLNGKGLKILILPSSRNEALGQEDWTNDWDEFPTIFEKVIKKIGGDYSNCILRGHPNWDQKIGIAGGEKISKYFGDWTDKTGISFIGSDSTISTSHLIEQADVVLLNGSSAVYEASALGTPSICVMKCWFQYANISAMILSDEELENFDVKEFFARSREDILKYTLRFFYAYAVRYSIFYDNIRAEDIHHFKYTNDIDFQRLLKMMEQYEIIPDDETYTQTEQFEDELVKTILEKKYHLINPPNNEETLSYKKIKRRGLYYFVEDIRRLFKRGDL